MEKICRVALVDDHTLFRNGLKTLLDFEPNMTVVLEAGSGSECLEKMHSTDFDVILMDIDMPEMDGFELSQHLMKTKSDAKIITLSMHGDREYYFRMVSLGVKGFLVKSSDIKEVITAINTVNEGGTFFSDELMLSITSSWKGTSNASVLSVREIEILLLICEGMSNNEIAEKLFISKRTVDKHRANILEKTSCKNTANLVVYAIKNKIAEI